MSSILRARDMDRRSSGILSIPFSSIQDSGETHKHVVCSVESNRAAEAAGARCCGLRLRGL